MTGPGLPHAACTDVGQRREHNEDALLAAPPLFAVADGVGGSARGEVASQLALDTLGSNVEPVASARSGSEAVHAMEQAVLESCRAVWEAQHRDEALRGMATTLTAVVVRDGGEVIVGHVGDSRLYLVNETGARLVTDDHSVVGELVRAGRLDPAEVASHPQRNVITRALGPEPDVAVDAFVLHVGPGDWLLACSDGLTGHVEDEEIARAVLENARDDPRVAALRLIDQANARGGSDNISVVLFQPVPSDVSGELRIRPLAAVGGASGQAPLAQTASMPAVESPAESSGPIDMAGRHAAGIDVEELDARPFVDHTAGAAPVPRTLKRTLAIVTAVLVAAGLGAFAWSESYFLMERGDGTVGIDRGFPVFGLSKPWKDGDVEADALTPSDRQRLVESHRLLSRGDAQRVFDGLADRVEPAEPEAAASTTPTPPTPAPAPTPVPATPAKTTKGAAATDAPTNP